MRIYLSFWDCLYMLIPSIVRKAYYRRRASLRYFEYYFISAITYLVTHTQKCLLTHIDAIRRGMNRLRAAYT